MLIRSILLAFIASNVCSADDHASGGPPCPAATIPSPAPAPAGPHPAPAPGGPPAPGTPPASGGPPTPGGPAAAGGFEVPPNSYPNARRDEKVQDTYPGNVIVHDPYRWLEKPDSDETKKFIDEENALTTSYLKKATFQQTLKSRYQAIDLHPTYSGPQQVGKFFFSWQNDAQRVQDVLYVQNSLTDKARVVLDPNTLSDGAVLDSDYTSFSEDGTIFAYSLTDGSDSDWRTVKFLSIENGDIYKEKLTKVKFSTLEWTFDNKGIFYGCYPDAKDLSGSDNEAETPQKIFYHFVGTDQSKDIMVAEFPDKSTNYMAQIVSVDGKYLIILARNAAHGNSVYIADLEKIKYEIKGKLDLIPIIINTDTDVSYIYVANVEKTFIFTASKDAPNRKLVTVDIGCPDPAKSMKDLVPTSETDILEGATPVYGKYLILDYTKDVKSVLQLHDINTGKMIKKFETEIGSLSTIFCDWRYKDLYFTIECYLSPGITYYCDLSKPPFDVTVYREEKLDNFDRQKFNSEQIFYKSKDGTKIPMTIISKKGLQKDGNNFTFLHGYGGFDTSTLPSFDVANILMVDSFDGVYAIANIRGGGEYGEKWHQEGSLLKKQNSFDDFQAAAEYLIAEKYTSPKMLTINGDGNGGLVVAVCLNQRPELFAAGIVEVGVLDMLRFNKFTNGKDWMSEYGDPSKKTDFDVLFKYSPLHNVKIPEDPKLQYPAVLLTTSQTNDRVPSLHSLKFIATLQHLAKCCNPKQKNPLLISISKTGPATGVDVMYQFIDMMSFLSTALGIKFHS